MRSFASTSPSDLPSRTAQAAQHSGERFSSSTELMSAPLSMRSFASTSPSGLPPCTFIAAHASEGELSSPVIESSFRSESTKRSASTFPLSLNGNSMKRDEKSARAKRIEARQSECIDGRLEKIKKNFVGTYSELRQKTESTSPAAPSSPRNRTLEGQWTRTQARQEPFEL